jgi:pseudaminic acid synthase
MEPAEFKALVEAVRMTEAALGGVNYTLSSSELVSRSHRRSLFVAEDMKAGELFTHYNVRSVRPADGLHTRFLSSIIGRRAMHDLGKGSPLSWSEIQ